MKLVLDYLDLYLVHFPIALEFVPFEERYPPGWVFDPDASEPRMRPVRVPLAETWAAMEELVSAGLVRNIGVCNFNCALLRDLLSYATVPPAVLQVELHSLLTQEKLLRFCREEGIAVTGFSPLGALSYVSLGMADADESLLGQPVVREAALRHGKTPAQVVLFTFELSPDEMQAISGLNRNHRFNDPGRFCEQAFGTFFPIYE